MEKVKEKTTGIELFAKLAAASVKYSIMGIYVFFSSIAHIANKVGEIKKNGQKNRKEI